jgi:tetratricopeptide (TPR) repeat protein
MRVRFPTLIAAAFGLLALASARVASPVVAQEPVHIEGLGSLSFPNSGDIEAQGDFLRGVLLMHSFEYEQAADAFRRAQEIDPDFAMAYWGEAMTHTHPVWNQKDAEAAREALDRLAPTTDARLAKAPTDREKAYLAAVEVLYGEAEKAALDTLYAVEMEKLAHAYPDDLEAQAFYALALLGLSQGDRNVPTYMEAGTIALAAFNQNPDHPGAAHYTIHSFDDPTHAILAMEAARAYSVIAPDAAHAQHMTTHIFLARGLWDDVVDQNVRAVAVANQARMERGGLASSCGHYSEWLAYGYQQQGRYELAADRLAECFAQSLDPERSEDARESAAFSYVYMRGLHLADTRDWRGATAVDRIESQGPTIDGGRVVDRLTTRLIEAWGDGVAAVHRGDRDEAEAAYAFLMGEGDKAPRNFVTPYVPVWQGTLEAMLLADAGDLDAAIRAAQRAADYEASLPVDFGPPIALKPAREVEGELLLESGQANEAMSAFQRQLDRTPNRIVTLGGFARASIAAGRTDLAEHAYRSLADLLSQADAGQPELADAEAFLSRLDGSAGR